MRRIHTLVAAFIALALLAVPGTALAKSKDSDRDRMPDRWEKQHGLSTKKKDAHLDPDRDGLSNVGEYRSGTNPKDADSDNDSVEDSDEDRDRDRVDNATELDASTNPRDADSDDDGVRDGREDPDRDGLVNVSEDATGNDPGDADSDDDGVEDGDEHAGRVSGWDPATGLLTIGLGNGSSVTGRVTADTEIGCETEDEHEDDDRGSAGTAVATRDDDDEDGEDGDDDRNEQSGVQSESADDDEADEDEADEEEYEGDDDDVCGPADLAVGIGVHEAELSLANGELVFDEIEIIK